jgi:Tfp pilus assembly protein PilF
MRTFLTVMLVAAWIAIPAAHAASPTNQPSVPMVSSNLPPVASDPVEMELKKITDDEEAFVAEVAQWIAEGGRTNSPEARAGLKLRIDKRQEAVGKAYAGFIQRHPRHTSGRIAYADFQMGTGNEDGARETLENALLTDTNNAAVYSGLGHLYTHTGPVRKAFDCFARAVELDPREPEYFQNFGTLVYLFRRDAMEIYGITEQQVFDKAMNLYSNWLRLDPTNFPAACDVASSYFGIRPLRAGDALKSWTNALSLARNAVEQEEVRLNIARIQIAARQFAAARASIDSVTNAALAGTKQRLLRAVRTREMEACGTNAPPATGGAKEGDPVPRALPDAGR